MPSEIGTLFELLKENELYNQYSMQKFEDYGRLNEYPNSLLASSDKYNSVEDNNWGPPVEEYAEFPLDFEEEIYKNRGDI